MPEPKTFLINNKMLDPISAHTLLDGLTCHMNRTANTLLAHKVSHPAGSDPDFHKLAINLHKLSCDITTFLNKKGNIAGEKTP
jgi:hypothetical protein